MKSLILNLIGKILGPIGLVELVNHGNGPERSNPQLRRHIDVAVYLISKNFSKDISILDVGCGTGMLAKRLRSHGFTSIDGSDWLPSEKVDHLIELGSYHQVDLNQESFDDKGLKKNYDLVISSDVVEHLESPAQFFRQVKPLLKEDGHLIITIPNAFNIFQKISFFFSSNSTRYRVEKPEEFGHISILTSNTLTSLLNRIEMTIKNVSGGGAFLSRFCLMPRKNFGPWLSYNLLYHIQHKTQQN